MGGKQTEVGMRNNQEQVSEPVVHSVRETAKILGIGERQAYEGIHRGEIPHLKIGKRFWVPRWFFTRLREGGAAE